MGRNLSRYDKVRQAIYREEICSITWTQGCTGHAWAVRCVTSRSRRRLRSWYGLSSLQPAASEQRKVSGDRLLGSVLRGAMDQKKTGVYVTALSDVETVEREIHRRNGPDDRQLAVADSECGASGRIVGTNDERVLSEPHEGDADRAFTYHLQRAVCQILGRDADLRKGCIDVLLNYVRCTFLEP